MQHMRDHITENEKNRPNPYKDSKGLLTVGTGFLVDDGRSITPITTVFIIPPRGHNERGAAALRRYRSLWSNQQACPQSPPQ